MTKVKTSTLRKKEEEDASLFITGPAELAEEDVAGSGEEMENDDERAHNNLINEIGKLSKKKRMGAAPRSVRFSTREGGTEVNRGDILKRIGLTDLEKSVDKVKTLPAPLEKVAVKRVKRAAGYDKVACESEKWAGLVHKRRTVDQLSFPLQQQDIYLHNAVKQDDKLRTPLEKEVYALLQGAKLVEDKKETKEMKVKRLAMSLEELKERNQLLWRERKERKRIERKAWMQNKNKSRKFHRLLRKDKLKKEKAELEELRKSNPEAALEKLEELERARVHERMTLRHKKSKWAQLQGLRVGRDETARSALKENLNLHQDLTAKRKLADSSDDDEEDEEALKAKLESLRKERQEAIEAGMFDPSNPWTANLLHQLPERAQVTPESAIDDSFVNFKKFWDEVNRRRLVEKKALEAVAEKERQMKMSQKDDDDEEGDDDDDEGMEEIEENDEEEMEESKDLTNGDTENAKEDSSDDKIEIGDGNGELVKKGDGKTGNKKVAKKIKGKKKQQKQKKEGDNLDTSKDTKKVKKTKKKKETKDDNDLGKGEESKTEGKKDAVAKKDKVKKKLKTKKKGKQVASKDDKPKDLPCKSKEKLTDGKSEDIEDLEDHLVSIDNMFSQAELGLQKKLKRKLEKLGIDASAAKEWTVVKSKKKPKKSQSILPKIEEFEFTAKTQDNIDEGLEQARTLEEIEALQKRSEEGNALQKAVDILKMGGKANEGNAKSDEKNTLQDSEEDSHSEKKIPSKTAQVDPSKFLQVDAKVLRAAMPDAISIGASLDDDEEDEEDADDVIQQAFADDYLVDEFRSAKNDAIEEDKPKTLSLVLPGWGEWTGPNIEVSKRKQQRFKITMPKPLPRKDSKMAHVIYNEKADVHANLRKAMVNELPYPFTRVQDFEASVRAPVGRLFVPEKQHKQLTAPPIVTKMGAVIEPMTEEELLKDRRLQRDQVKKANKAKKILAEKSRRQRGRKFGNKAKRQMKNGGSE